jgi:hypothetical protein
MHRRFAEVIPLYPHHADRRLTERSERERRSPRCICIGQVLLYVVVPLSLLVSGRTLSIRSGRLCLDDDLHVAFEEQRDEQCDSAWHSPPPIAERTPMRSK